MIPRPERSIHARVREAVVTAGRPMHPAWVARLLGLPVAQVRTPLSRLASAGVIVHHPGHMWAAPGVSPARVSASMVPAPARPSARALVLGAVQRARGPVSTAEVAAACKLDVTTTRRALWHHSAALRIEPLGRNMWRAS